ncbi:hypothetical protein [Streptomyces sp. NPDC001340]
MTLWDPVSGDAFPVPSDAVQVLPAGEAVVDPDVVGGGGTGRGVREQTAYGLQGDGRAPGKSAGAVVATTVKEIVIQWLSGGKESRSET